MPPAIDRDTFDELVLRGHSLYDAMRESVTSGPAVDKPLPALKPGYVIDITPEYVPQKPKTSLRGSALPVERYQKTVVRNVDQQGYIYFNYFRALGDAILCSINYNLYDELWGTPESMYWSDLMAICCARTVAPGGN